MIETEEDLTGAIDELPAGTEEEPSDVIVETEISVTNPVTVKDKYITLGGGGTLNSLNSGGIFSVNNGGLVLDNITLKGQWIDKRPLLEVLNGSILNIHPNTMIHSKSDHLRRCMSTRPVRLCMRVLWRDIFIVSVLCRCSPEQFMARSVRLPLSNFQVTRRSMSGSFWEESIHI